MKITLTCTWNPHGELPYLEQLLPQLEEIYAALVITIRPGKLVQVEPLNRHPNLLVFEMADRGWGRYQGLEKALEVEPDYIHYADLDTILYWVDNRPDEWRQTLTRFPQADCLVIGRSQRAFATRPQAIQQTEQIINRVFSHALGQEMDFGLGNRIYSQQAAEVIIQQSGPGHWGDAEWPILIQQAGMKLEYYAVDGADWLPSDRSFADELTPESRQAIADTYDQQAKSWAGRTRVAQQIIGQGLKVIATKFRR